MLWPHEKKYIIIFEDHSEIGGVQGLKVSSKKPNTAFGWHLKKLKEIGT